MMSAFRTAPTAPPKTAADLEVEKARIDREYQVAVAAGDPKAEALWAQLGEVERALGHARNVAAAEANQRREAGEEASRTAHAAGCAAAKAKSSAARDKHEESGRLLRLALTEGVPAALQQWVDTWAALDAAATEERRWKDPSPLPFRTGREVLDALQAEILRIQFRAASPAQDELLVAFAMPTIPGRKK